jgi:cytochrome b subunit of formate dehydrogenase
MPEKTEKNRLADLKAKLKEELEKELFEELTQDLTLTPELTLKVKEMIKQRVGEELKPKLDAIILEEEEKRAEVEKEIPPPPPKEIVYYPRFSLNIRTQHVILMISVLILIITGLPIKFHESAWAAFFFPVVGGIEVVRLWHRIGAAGLMGIAAYHCLFLILTKEGWKTLKDLLPRVKDFKDVWMMVNFFLGRSKRKPRLGKFTYVEKFDYWAVYWGVVIMVGSGLILWFFEPTLKIFPKFVVDIANEAHSDEAFLATLAIVIWHFYNAHLNPDKFPMNPSWLTGKMSEEDMKEEHYLEWERMEKEKESR